MPHKLPLALVPPTDGSSWSPPLDVLDVAVRLETAGVTDAVARSDYWFKSTWDMASSYFPNLERLHGSAVPEEARPQPWREYLKGISFALPLVLCCLSMLALKFSLWGGDVSEDLAAALGLGIVSSFVVTGGFVQAMARRGLFYSGVSQQEMCRICCWRWLRLGLLGLTLAGLGLLAASLYFRWFHAPLDSIALVFHFALGSLWLTSGILYMFERNWLVVAAALLGIGCVALLHLGFHLSLLTAQVLGILSAAAFCFLASWTLLRRASGEDAEAPQPQSLARDLYYAWPHFLYGGAYFLFLFADRLLAWTAANYGAPLSLRFRGDYETALDIALFAFILQVGWVRASVSDFFATVPLNQRSSRLGDGSLFNRGSLRIYARELVRFLPIALISSLVVYKTADWFGLFLTQATRTTTLWSLAGYPFLVIGLWNASLLFRLSRPTALLPAIAAALLADLAFGYAMSRIVSYQMAVFGFTVGSVLFGSISSLQVIRRLESLDYYYFSSAV